MSKNFGKTWWGDQFLNSLSNIDFSNRLPRGSRYARNGSVKSIKIEGNTISAKVQGSASRPYSITIVIPPFFEAEIKKMIRDIAKKPVIVSKLLNRELDPEMLEIASKNGLKVFPNKWSDFKMQCSCPDWAVPCKHIAAVIYMVSHEIDNNPFLVFELHKVNLPEELKKEGIHIQDILKEDIPLLSKLYVAEEKSSKKTKKIISEPESDNAYSKLSFRDLAFIGDPLIHLLQENPAFYTGTGCFREKYAVTMRKIIKSSQKTANGKSPLIEPAEQKNLKNNKSDVESSSPIISRHDQFYIQLNGAGEALIFREGSGETINIVEFISELWRMPHSQLMDYQPSVPALHSSLQLAVNLLANGAVVPQIVMFENKKYSIRWLPALLSNDVKFLTASLKEILPLSILRLAEKKMITRDAELHIVSLWLNTIIKKYSGAVNEDEFTTLFFDGKPAAFKGPAQQAIAGGIQSWLQRYYIAQGIYRPVIVVEDKDDIFELNISIKDKKNPLDNPLLLADVLSLDKHTNIRYEILQSLAQLSALIPGLDKYINSGGSKPHIINPGDFSNFIMDAIPAIQLLDIDVLLPKSLQSILRPKASVRIKKKSESSGFLRLDKLLAFDWQVAVGDTLMDEGEFSSLMKQSEGLIRFKTGYIYVNHSDLEKLKKHFSSSKVLNNFEMLRAALSNDYHGARVCLTDEVKKIIEDLTSQSETALPAGLNASLRPYQHRGYSWLYRNSRIGFGSILADDMGLGKTLQVIATLLKYREEGFLKKEKALVVAPTGLLTNWQAEIDKFAPTLKYQVYHGAERALPDGDYDVLITSYGIGRSDIEKLKKMKWHVVVIDEAQNIKNSETAQSKAIKSLPANMFIAMSGTPVENRITELWSIMDFCNRGFLGSVNEFKETFANPIQNQNDIAAADKLKAVTSPFLLRRLKSDKTIISDLPDKIEIDSYCYLNKSQASLYETTLHKALEAIEGIELTDQKSLFVRQGLVLQMILALKQICNHPTQFLKNGVMDSSLSGKTEMLFDTLEPILQCNEKLLIFTQFTGMGDLLKSFITERFGEQPLFYHGGCSIKQRKEMVDAFQYNRADKIFILSLKAGGTGLNLTAANHVIHYDLWWNPAVEAQATDRAYRIGQKSNVMVHRFITKGTFEERINEMIQKKKNLANMTVATGENWIGNLSNKEIRDLFDLNRG